MKVWECHSGYRWEFIYENEKFMVTLYALEPLGRKGQMGQGGNLKRKVGFGI